MTPEVTGMDFVGTNKILTQDYDNEVTSQGVVAVTTIQQW